MTGSPGSPPFYTTQVWKRKIAVELDFHPGGGGGTPYSKRARVLVVFFRS